MRRIWSAISLSALFSAGMLFGCGGDPGEKAFRAGLQEIDRGHYVRGKALLEKSISQRPGSEANAVAHLYLGYASWKLGQVSRASESFEYARRLGPTLFEAPYNLAVLRLDSGDDAKAIPLFEEAAAADRADPRPLEFLGALHLQSGKWPEARRALFGALARAPQSPRILTALALVENAAGNPDKAVFYLMHALEKKQDYLPALYNLGLLYGAALKDREQAAAYLRQYLERAGTDPHAESARAALAALAGGPPKAAPPPAPAVTAAVTAAATAPAASLPVTTASVGDLLAQAADDIGRGRVQDALGRCLKAALLAEQAGQTNLQEKALREAVRLCVDQAPAHDAMGRFLLAQGQSDAAARAFKHAAMLDARYAPAYLGLAYAAARTGEFDAALVALKQAIKLEPANADALWRLAVLYEEGLGNKARAAQAYREFEKLFPGDARVLRARERIGSEPRAMPAPARPGSAAATLPAAPRSSAASDVEAELPARKTEIRNTQAAVQAYNQGTAYQRQQNWDRAAYYYARAVENDDHFTTAYFNLGVVYSAKGEYDLARAAYRRALVLRPDMSAARYNLALLLGDGGDRAGAVEQLNTLLRNQPDYARAHYALGLYCSQDPTALAQARRHYEKFLQLAPESSSAGAVRAWLAAH